jgi:trafficking protein particle complex subunit 13
MADQQPLAFRLLRLKPPSLHLAPDARFNLEEDFGTLPLAVPPVAVDGPFADRIQLRTASQMGVTGTLVLPQSFGAVYLGQTLTLAIAMQNTSRVVPLHRIGIKIEVVTDRGKVVLYDSTPSEGLSVLAPGEYHELLVKHDVKDQGSVTMVVKAWYLIAGGSERKYQGGSFVFSVENPLIVRTRVS